jgi:hypothetical protein
LFKEWNMRESNVVKEWEDVGRRGEAAESILDVLQIKFGALPQDLPGQLGTISDLAILRQLRREAIDTGSLDDFRKLIPNEPPSGEH